MNKKFNKIILSIVSFLSLPYIVGATGVTNTGLNPPPIGPTSIGAFMVAFFGVISKFAVIPVVLALMYAGFLFVTAQGNAEDIKKAKSIFLWAIVGAIVLIGAQSLTSIMLGISKDLGVKGL